MKPIRLAIVDDSPFIRSALVKLLQDTRLSVVGVAQTGEELLANLDAWKPDIITLDIHMPGIGGMRTLDHIMARRPTPVIMMSTHSGAGAPLTVEALGRGAADFIDKEEFSLVDFQRLRVVLLEKATALTARSDAAAKNKVRRPEPAEVHAAARHRLADGRHSARSAHGAHRRHHHRGAPAQRGRGRAGAVHRRARTPNLSLGAGHDRARP